MKFSKRKFSLIQGTSTKRYTLADSRKNQQNGDEGCKNSTFFAARSWSQVQWRHQRGRANLWCVGLVWRLLHEVGVHLDASEAQRGLRSSGKLGWTSASHLGGWGAAASAQCGTGRDARVGGRRQVGRFRVKEGILCTLTGKSLCVRWLEYGFGNWSLLF